MAIHRYTKSLCYTKPVWRNGILSSNAMRVLLVTMSRVRSIHKDVYDALGPGIWMIAKFYTESLNVYDRENVRYIPLSVMNNILHLCYGPNEHISSLGRNVCQVCIVTRDGYIYDSIDV